MSERINKYKDCHPVVKEALKAGDILKCKRRYAGNITGDIVINNYHYGLSSPYQIIMLDNHDYDHERIENIILDEDEPDELPDQEDYGKMIEIKDFDNYAWERRKLITILPLVYYPRFVCEQEFYKDRTSNWKYARKIKED